MLWGGGKMEEQTPPQQGETSAEPLGARELKRPSPRGTEPSYPLWTNPRMQVTLGWGRDTGGGGSPWWTLWAAGE